MRLLHTTELRFEEFFDSNIPRYAILSHRWGPDEVSYQEFTAIRQSYSRPMLDLLDWYFPGWFDVIELLTHVVPSWAVAIVLFGELVAHSLTSNLAVCALIVSLLLVLAWRSARLAVRPKRYGSGYAKILACCDYAATDAYNGPFLWVWIDTCSIDKSSSAELSEAINSMYRWYRRAVICYAYLSDVSSTREDSNSLICYPRSTADPRVLKDRSDIGKSVWFTRGWTLQELLAPRSLLFLATDWTPLGTRSRLARKIETITGISVEHLPLEERLQDVNIATKLSWTANRETSRLEDTAYCLLGLFNLKMPLLYGEGHSAFRRLLKDLVGSTNDESLFAWYTPDYNLDDKVEISVGLLVAMSLRWGSVLQPDEHEFSPIKYISRPRYSITNQGLELIVPEDLIRKGKFLLPLNCRHYEGKTLKGVYAILLWKSGSMWERILSGSYVKNFSTSSDDVYCFHKSGLYIVPTAWVWSREDLARRGSVVIYATIEGARMRLVPRVTKKITRVRSNNNATPGPNDIMEIIPMAHHYPGNLFKMKEGTTEGKVSTEKTHKPLTSRNPS